MPSVYTYNDYRAFMADYYEMKKKENRKFSYQSFSRTAGFGSKSFVYNIINGKKNLSSASVVKICEAMGLNATESAYFENLVSLNQASDIREQAFFFHKLNSLHIREKQAAKIKHLRKDQYDYYSNWYTITIRSLIDLFGYKNDYRKLAKMVYPSISPQQAKKSVKLLERLKLIIKQKNGEYIVSEKLLTTGKLINNLAVRQFHIDTMKLAEKALQNLPVDKRNVSGLTLGISGEAYQKICDIILECQDKIMCVAEQDEHADMVYQLNFHLFPVSKKNIERDAV